MTDASNQSLNEGIYEAKLEMRKRRAAEPFEKKMLALVRMQMVAYEMAKAAGRPGVKPWHFDDEERMNAYAEGDSSPPRE